MPSKLQHKLSSATPMTLMHNSISPKTSNFKLPSTPRVENNSVRHRKLLDSSASQKYSSSKIELLLSPKNKSLIKTKLINLRPPKVKIISIKTKITMEKKISKFSGFKAVSTI
jgi:hypothetical protein